MPILIGGDLNAKYTSWNSKTLDARGKKYVQCNNNTTDVFNVATVKNIQHIWYFIRLGCWCMNSTINIAILYCVRRNY